MKKTPKCLYTICVNIVKTTDKNDKTYNTIQVKLDQKPCHIKIAYLSELNVFLRTTNSLCRIHYIMTLNLRVNSGNKVMHCHCHHHHHL